MNLDEQISKRVDKGYRFELWNENVIPTFLNKIQKAIYLGGLFFYKTVIRFRNVKKI